MIQSIDVLKLCTIDISYCIFHIITNYHYFCRYFYFWKVFSITKLVKILVMRLVGKYTTKYVLDMQIRRRRLSNSFLLRLIINTALSIGTLQHALFFPSYRFLPNNYGRPLPTQLCPQSPLLLVYLSYHADQMILSNSIAPGTDMTSAISPLPYTLTLSDVHDNLNHYAVAYAGHSTPSTSLMVAF